MSRVRLVLAALLAALGVTAFASAAAAPPPKLVGTVGPGYTTLVGTVGPGFTITLTGNGKKVTTLKAGKYLLVVEDKASIHSFVIEQQSGGKLEKDLTTPSFTGTSVYSLTLAKGKYKYYCRPHESSMFGFFTVT
jgi:plastocyanin